MAMDMVVPGQRIRFGWPWLLAGVAWVIVVAATLTGQRAVIDHHFLLEDSRLPWPVAAVVFLLGWQVMIAAMMVPASIRIATQQATMTTATSQDNPHPQWRLAAFFAAYSSIWTAFGVLAFAGDTLVHRMVDSWPWLATHSVVIGATTLAGAGLFQFSRLKGVCLARCRDRHMQSSGTDTTSAASPWHIGLRHGADSVGCCWALMLIMFGIGVGDLAWMAGLTATMLAETRTTDDRRGKRTSEMIGILLIVLAALWLIHPAWLVPATLS